jgi:hypothetical protein
VSVATGEAPVKAASAGSALSAPAVVTASADSELASIAALLRLVGGSQGATPEEESALLDQERILPPDGSSLKKEAQAEGILDSGQGDEQDSSTDAMVADDSDGQPSAGESVAPVRRLVQLREAPPLSIVPAVRPHTRALPRRAAEGDFSAEDLVLAGRVPAEAGTQPEAKESNSLPAWVSTAVALALAGGYLATRSRAMDLSSGLSP